MALSQNKSNADAKTANRIEKPKRDLVLSHQDAQSAIPDDISNCGEEDPGAGLESLVTNQDKNLPGYKQ